MVDLRTKAVIALSPLKVCQWLGPSFWTFAAEARSHLFEAATPPAGWIANEGLQSFLQVILQKLMNHASIVAKRSLEDCRVPY
ncbi:hypothetical protein [uncultured Tateyamaria sp.]|uniref:hypothetical protein n=1 Tax=uncultured Tateyamaria sp. TaxID=455651 RepID=UPI002631C27D|nr:hypothetical protein [uncultured Tateyamaria sp.]